MTESQQAIFAAGCFWGVEEHFRTMAGVSETEVGYIGGHTDNPDYKSVCTGKTEHAEAVRIVFDPQKINFDALLNEFWVCHDPTQKDRQGLDVGRQYRSAIFIQNDAQHTSTAASKAQAQAQFSRPIATEILPNAHFYPAEDYHQQYIAKRRGLI